MKKNIFYSPSCCLLLILLLSFSNIFARAERNAWLLLSSEQELVSTRDGKASFRNVAYNDFLERASINTIRKAFPYSRNDTLRRLYSVSVLQEAIPILMSEKKVERVFIEEDWEDTALFNPSDLFWSVRGCLNFIFSFCLASL